MDDVVKALKKIPKHHGQKILLLLDQIATYGKKTPGCKPLSNSSELFRVRSGPYRIIFRDSKGTIEIRRLVRRTNSTYKNL